MRVKFTIPVRLLDGMPLAHAEEIIFLPKSEEIHVEVLNPDPHFIEWLKRAKIEYSEE